MNLILVAVYDAKVEAFMTPIFQRSVGEAIRTFSNEASNPKSQISQHPGDFTLYKLATLDQSNGKVVPNEPVEIARGFDFVQSTPEVVNE